MGIALSDTPVRLYDPLGSQPLLLRKRRGGEKNKPQVSVLKPANVQRLLSWAGWGCLALG